MPKETNQSKQPNNQAPPQQQFVEAAKKLNDYIVKEKIDAKEVDAVLEFLTDKGFVNEKGKALSYAYWYTYIREK